MKKQQDRQSRIRVTLNLSGYEALNVLDALYKAQIEAMNVYAISGDIESAKKNIDLYRDLSALVESQIRPQIVNFK